MLSLSRERVSAPQEYRLAESGAFTIRRGGKDVGALYFSRYSGPIPHIYVSNLEIEIEFQGKGLGSQLMKKVEGYIKKKNIPGIIIDGTYLDDPAHGMYARRGWKPLYLPQAYGVFSFNQCGYADDELWRAYTHGED